MAAAHEGRPSQAWALGFGVQSWLIWFAVPLLFRADVGLLDLGLGALPLMVLAGVFLRLRGGGGLPIELALAGFPLSLAVALTGFGHRASLATYSPVVLLLGIGSLLAFLASCSALASAPGAVRPGRVKALAEARLALDAPRRERWQNALLGGTACGFLAILVFATRGTALEFHNAWGEQAAEGATLTAVMAGLIGAGAMTGIVGPALRSERGPATTSRQQNRRLRLLVAVAASGVAAYVIVILRAR